MDTEKPPVTAFLYASVCRKAASDGFSVFLHGRHGNLIYYFYRSYKGFPYEAGFWTDAVLLWSGDDADAVHPSYADYPDFCYRVSDFGVLSVLFLTIRKKLPHMRQLCGSFSDYALSTNPERKQDVHTYIFLTPPFTLTRTDLMFALQIALDLLWEWLTLLPKWAAFSQIAHFAMIAPP